MLAIIRPNYIVNDLVIDTIEVEAETPEQITWKVKALIEALDKIDINVSSKSRVTFLDN